MTNSVFECGYYFLNFPCFHIQKHLILHALAISLKVSSELRLAILKQIVHRVSLERFNVLNLNIFLPKMFRLKN